MIFVLFVIHECWVHMDACGRVIEKYAEHYTQLIKQQSAYSGVLGLKTSPES